MCALLYVLTADVITCAEKALDYYARYDYIGWQTIHHDPGEQWPVNQSTIPAPSTLSYVVAEAEAWHCVCCVPQLATVKSPLFPDALAASAH
jgi:hypothetical protein